MLRKPWFWITIILIVLVLIATSIVSSDDCKKVSDSGVKDNCYISKAMEQGTIKTCEKTSTLEAKEGCYDAVAGVLKDTSICEKIGPREKISNCYTNVAVKKQDVLVCDTIEDESEIEECYVYVAEELSDASICEKIKPDEYGRQSSVKDNCYMVVAIKRNDRELCYRIRGVWKDNCIQNTEGDTSTGATGRIEYGEGDCMPLACMNDNCSDSRTYNYFPYDGKIFFIDKLKFDTLGEGDFNLLRESSDQTNVTNGNYKVYLNPGEYVVMPEEIYQAGYHVNISAGIMIEQNFKFLKCTSY